MEMGGPLTMYETLDKIDGPNFKQNRFFPATNDSYNYTTCSKMIYVLKYILLQKIQETLYFFSFKKECKKSEKICYIRFY